jgi:hypothetical protein
MKKSIVLGVILAAGCDTTMTGNSGTLELSYTHGGLFESVSNPIGAGLMADVVIREIGSEDPLLIDSAASSDETILTVSGLDGSRMDLLAGGAGVASLSVDAQGLSDAFDITVEDIASVSYGTIVYGQEDNVIAAGASLWVPRTAYGESGSSLTGYGLPMPEITPIDSAVGIEDGAIGSTKVQFSVPGEVQLSDGVGEATTYTVIDGADVSWSVEDGVSEENPMSIGETPLVLLSGVDSEGRTVLGSLSSVDAAICTVEAVLGSAEIYMVSALAEGTCEVTLNGNTDAPFLSLLIGAE